MPNTPVIRKEMRMLLAGPHPEIEGASICGYGVGSNPAAEGTRHFFEFVMANLRDILDGYTDLERENETLRQALIRRYP